MIRVSRYGSVRDEGTTNTPFCPVGLVRLGSKFAIRSFCSINGEIKSHRRPRLRVMCVVSFQSSCAKYPCSQLWTIMGGRGFSTKVAVVGGRPSKKSAKGSVGLSLQL